MVMVLERWSYAGDIAIIGWDDTSSDGDLVPSLVIQGEESEMMTGEK